MSRLVTIGEAARELGVSTKTLRRYEERGLLKPIRTMGGQRRYYLSASGLLASAEEDEDDVA
jgi:DNA-binding transcriptional MerR regulator